MCLILRALGTLRRAITHILTANYRNPRPADRRPPHPRSMPALAAKQALPRAAVRLLAITTLIATGTACKAEDAAAPAARQISCLLTRKNASIQCMAVAGSTTAAPDVDPSRTAIVLRAQDNDVAVVVDSALWKGDSISFNASVRNLATQSLGTADGVTPDPRGIVILAAPDTTPAIDVSSAAVQSALTADPARYAPGIAARFLGILDPGQSSVPQRIWLRTPRSADTASVALLVVAPVANPHGWMRLDADGATSGTTADAVAVRLDAIGRPLPSGPVTLSSLTPPIATAADARVTGRAIGLARITASCAPPCAARSDTAAIAVAAPGGVTLTVRPSERFPISRFIYGANFVTDDGAASAGRWPWFGADVPRGVTLNRIGGNRLSAYNWRNNYSHAGLDYQFQNDQLLDPSTTPGEAIRRRVAGTMERGAATLVTIPMLPFLAGDAEAKPLDTLASTHAARMRAHFVANRATRGANDPANAVYQDEFVRWLNAAFPTAAADANRALFYSLDNEPDIWYETHRAIMSDTLGKRRKETYDGFTNTSIAFATAVKRAQPSALIFGPATATYTGVASLGRYPDADPVHGKAPFFEFYLDRMRTAERTSGRRVLDVLDMHWYAEAFTRGGPITNDYAPQDEETIQKRLQAPRSLWDSTYNEGSWVSGYTKGPVALIPRLRRMIARHYPGTKIAITEYYYGRSGDISGGLAQADVLGIFGREGVFAATLWPQANVWAWKGIGAEAYRYAFGAFRLFRDYDGAGASFGDTGLWASSSAAAKASIYASRSADGRVVLVVINKTNAPLRADIPMGTGPQPTLAHVFTMKDGAPVPMRAADIPVSAGKALQFTMPAYSASTLVLSF